MQQKLQEYRLLLDIGESGGDTSQLEPSIALTLARLARATLASEHQLALAKLDACQKELVVLQDAVDEALVFLTDADLQLGHIFNKLDEARIAIPKHPLLSSPPVPRNPNFERPDYLFCFPMEEGDMEEEEQSSGSTDSFCSFDSGGESPPNLTTSTILPQ